MFILVKDDIIQDVVQTDNEEYFLDLGYIRVPDDCQVHVGQNINFFCPKYNVRSDKELLERNLIQLEVQENKPFIKDGQIIEKLLGDSIVSKTLTELFEEDQLELGSDQYFCKKSEEIKQITDPDQLLESGDICSIKHKEYKTSLILHKRRQLLDTLDDLVMNPFRFEELSENEVQELREFRRGLLDITEHPDFPNIVLPDVPEILK